MTNRFYTILRISVSDRAVVPTRPLEKVALCGAEPNPTHSSSCVPTLCTVFGTRIYWVQADIMWIGKSGARVQLRNGGTRK